jgi:hypothetical protein
MSNKFFEFIGHGLITPFIYAFYSIITILFTFLIGFPIGIGIYLILYAIKLIFNGGLIDANL